METFRPPEGGWGDYSPPPSPEGELMETDSELIELVWMDKSTPRLRLKEN